MNRPRSGTGSTWGAAGQRCIAGAGHETHGSRRAYRGAGQRQPPRRRPGGCSVGANGKPETHICRGSRRSSSSIGLRPSRRACPSPDHRQIEPSPHRHVELCSHERETHDISSLRCPSEQNFERRRAPRRQGVATRALDRRHLIDPERSMPRRNTLQQEEDEDRDGHGHDRPGLHASGMLVS